MLEHVSILLYCLRKG